MEIPHTKIFQLLSKSVRRCVSSTYIVATKKQSELYKFLLDNFDNTEWECEIEQIYRLYKYATISWDSIAFSKKVFDTFNKLVFPVVISCHHGYWQCRAGGAVSWCYGRIYGNTVQTYLTWSRLSKLLKHNHKLIMYDGGFDIG